MLTLSRGGPIVGISETDATEGGIKDNDLIEIFNVNGALLHVPSYHSVYHKV